MSARRLFNVRLSMRDGVELSSDIWIPDSGGKYPLILLRTPYLKTSQPINTDYNKLANFFVAEGYAVAVQDVRGRGDSDGEYGYYFQESDDGFDTVELMAIQPWCDGRVGIMGASYLGAAGWFAARQRPPHLVCLAATAAPGDFMREMPYVNGAFLQYRLQWCNYVSGRINQNNIRNEDWPSVLSHRPLLTADEVMGRRMPLYREWLDHPTLDEYWKRLILSDGDYQGIRIPALHVTGWFDSTQPGAMRHWIGMADHSPASRHQFLIAGPWDHGQSCNGGLGAVGAMKFTDESVVDLLRVHLDFFDTYLKRTRARFRDRQVQLFVTGSNVWKTFDCYPVSDTGITRLYLSSQGHANSLQGDGLLVPVAPAREPHDQYEFDPANPVPLDPMAAGGIYGVDRQVPEHRGDILVYTSDTLASAVEVIGPVSVTLFAASDAPDTDFAAALVDVYPDRRAVVLGPRPVGIVRARYRRSLETAELLSPHKVERYEIDLGHIAHSFEAGHRIRVEITSSAAPMYNPNQNTGHPVALDTEQRVARQRVYHNAQYPSAVVLPTVETEADRTPFHL